ncbi:hypothetical protein EGT07_02500 [Herbaspirillum sp. HC18]|nr:hypothetical protein EGT07_02500 [Herbaspirillum sp. HC18]
MLQQILSRTPIWVWALLAFLVYRGLVASVDREVGFGKIFIIPAAMLALSVQAIATGFGARMAIPVWLLFMLLGAALAWQFFNTGNVAARLERHAVFLKGSWTPLLLILGIFLTKYAANVAMAIRPELKGQLVFVAGISALYGVFNGVFVGQALRIASIYRQGVARSNYFL